MKRQDYSFKFSLFSKKVQMFQSYNVGIVVEKEPHVICVYGTNSDHSKILCAVPLCPPKYLKGETFYVSFFEDRTALVRAADFMVHINFTKRECSNNKGLQNYGSEWWGELIGCPWESSFEQKSKTQ